MNVETPDAILWRLKSELSAYLGGIPAEILADGIKAAPWAILQTANWLAWHATTFDAVPIPQGQTATVTMAALAREMQEAVRPLCGTSTPPAPTAGERIAALESQIANLRVVLANRKGETL